ncbi:MAG: hypothetical protein IKH04_02295 [Kiritimatiellae bacterium]|nr:hypothetical protein [Kiritimatiellia bacterium]
MNFSSDFVAYLRPDFTPTVETLRSRDGALLGTGKSIFIRFAALPPPVRE